MKFKNRVKDSEFHEHEVGKHRVMKQILQKQNYIAHEDLAY